MAHEARQPRPHVRISRAVDGGVGQRARAREEFLRLVAVEIQNLGAAPGGQVQPLGPAAGHDRATRRAVAPWPPTEARGPPSRRSGCGPAARAEPVPAVEDGGERIEKRGGLVGSASGRPMEVRPPRRRPAHARTRRRLPRSGRRARPRTGWRGRAGSPRSGRTVPRPPGTTRRPRAIGVDARRPTSDDFAAELVAHRDGKRDARHGPRVSSFRSVPQVSAVRTRTIASPGPGSRRRDVALGELADRGLDEGSSSGDRMIGRSGDRRIGGAISSRFSLADESRQIGQHRRRRELAGGRDGLVDRLREHAVRALDAPDDGERRLARRGVLARTSCRGSRRPTRRRAGRP